MSETIHKIPTIKFIAGRILAVWAIIIFICTMFVAVFFLIPCFFLAEPHVAILHRKVTQIWMRFFLFFIGCRIKIKGADNFVRGENYVVVCNHNSLMDVPVSTPFMPRANKTIAKVSFSKVPIFGWVYKFGSVLVDRRSDQSRRQSYEEMKAILAVGLDMLIYPEGTRNKTTEPLKSFYDGAFKLSIEAQKPIIPVVLLNTKKILPARPILYFTPGKIDMHILAAIYPQGYDKDSLKKAVFDVMANYYLENNDKN